MEIDFLGLNSKYSTQFEVHTEASKQPYTDSENEISLSLGTSSRSPQEVFGHYGNKKWKQPDDNSSSESTMMVEQLSLGFATRPPLHQPSTTVAMARKATLARFLGKRSHRMRQTKKLLIMGQLLDPNDDV